MMPIDGSVHDAHTFLGVEELNHFSPNFKEYIQQERLNWSRFELRHQDIDGRLYFGWVFWSQRDRQTQLDNFADLIRHALQKLIFMREELRQCLVQFWAATKTSEGRTLLTTQFQPFALGKTYNTDERERLCEYRMGMCREYNSFYAEAECAQEQLGLPGRVFLHQLPESTPDVEHYTLKEYPQREFALRCGIVPSWAVPVLDHSSHTCVGVLEIVSLNQYHEVHNKSFVGKMYEIFQMMAEYMEDGREYFLPNFEEYMERELNYSLLENSEWNWEDIGWVFWNRQDNNLTLSYDHSVDSIPDVCASPKIRLNIRHALHKLISHPEFRGSLVQFWAPTRTLQGRTLLTTQFQPFALGTTSYFSEERHQLCSYRLGMCREYNNKFYADADSGEEQLGLPGRVFLNQLPEHAPDVGHYTLKEYPQRDLALSCEICESWALPVFEQSSHTCVGVLEIAYNNLDDYDIWHDEEFLGRMYDIFQEFGLRCFDGYKHCEIQDGDENKALTTAFQELNMVYESVCKIHDLPLALTWVSCRSCNHLLQSQFKFYLFDEEYYDNYSFDLGYFIEVSNVCHLRKGQVAGRILSIPNLLYCSDVKQFHINEFPLVLIARCCESGGWFTMCLQSSYTGDELYVLEFFLPKRTKNDENIFTKLRLILGTMEKSFKTFKLASGQGLGEALSVEVIDFQYGQRSHSIQTIPATIFIPSLELVQDGGVMLQQVQQDQPSMDAINNGMHVASEAQNYDLPSFDSLQNGKVTMLSDRHSMDPSNKGQNVVIAERNILVVSSSKQGKSKTQDEKHKKARVRIEVSLEEILKCSKMRREDAAKELEVSISTLKRVCRDFGIHRWPPRNIRKAQPLPVENLGQTPQLNCDLPSNQASTSVAHIKPSFQDANMVTIRATCEKNTIKFRLSLSARLVEMQQEVAKRLNLKGGTYYIKYKDEEDVLILIACDEDLQDCLHTSRSLGISSIAVLLELK